MQKKKQQRGCKRKKAATGEMEREEGEERREGVGDVEGGRERL